MRRFRGGEWFAGAGNPLRELALRQSRKWPHPPRTRSLAFRRRPSFLADERHEPHVSQVLAFKFVLRNPGDANQLLNFGVAAHRNDKPSADLELLLERFRN